MILPIALLYIVRLMQFMHHTYIIDDKYVQTFIFEQQNNFEEFVSCLI